MVLYTCSLATELVRLRRRQFECETMENSEDGEMSKPSMPVTDSRCSASNLIKYEELLMWGIYLTATATDSQTL